MWVSRLEIENIRSWTKAEFYFSQGINVLIGPNNSGKSTIIHSLLVLQKELPDLTKRDLRLGAASARVAIHLDGASSKGSFLRKGASVVVWHLAQGKNPQLVQLTQEGNESPFAAAPAQDLSNFIYPVLSKRKVPAFEEKIDAGTATRVVPNLSTLNARIDTVANVTSPAYETYRRTCEDILGFFISATSTERGKIATYTIQGKGNIPISVMGDGVPNILGLIAYLCVADDTLFLIEEPENDIHPDALKKLLALVNEKAHTNQFIITTHSNVVVRHLGAQPGAKLFHVDIAPYEDIPTSTRAEVDDSPDQRRAVLASLGYELIDYDLWDAWLFLEESSAEKIIREYLIRWFADKLLGRLRTFSADSLSEVRPKFESFNTLFSYLHLTPVYRNKAWVIVDAGAEEATVISALKRTYCEKADAEKRWREAQFLQFSEHDFERYYPKRFRAQVDEVLELTDKGKKRDRKKQLLNDVEAWIADNPDEAKDAFERSAAEVIDRVRDIERELKL